MPTDTVQIGSFAISRVILDIIAPLIGTIIGGLISYISITNIENRKIKQQKLTNIQEQKREAIKIALQWIDPFHNAITKISLSANPYHPSQINTEHWPNLIRELTKYDVPRHLLVFLPDQTYKKSFDIIRYIDELRYSATCINETSSIEERKQFFETSTALLHKIHEQFDELSKMLEDEYRNTFL